jgi:hypothetical protein
MGKNKKKLKTMSTLLAGHYKLIHMAQMSCPAKEMETTLKATLKHNIISVH